MKKLISILILVSMIISLFSFNVSAAEQQGNTSTEDYDILNALSVINAESWADGTVTTRAEFIQLCVNLTGNGDIKSANTQPVFTDLTVSHWAYDAIMYAYSMGYITPYSDGHVMPESPVTYGDALQIMVNFLGYQVMAAGNNSGDSTQAYLKTASDIGLLDGVVSDGINRPLLKSSAVRMAYNALTVELPVQYFSNNNVFFNVQEDRTLLKVKFDAYRVKGVVRADDYASLSHDLARENYVTIDNENYFSANTDVEGLLGCTVLFYYIQPEGSEEKELIYISPVDNEITEINAMNLSGYSNMKVNVISDSGKKTSYALGKDTTVIWNNKIISSSEYAEKFKIKSGSARLIDNDGDGTVEVVILESQKVGKIAINNTKDMELKLEDGKVYKLDDYRNYRIENRYGERIDALALHVEDIVSVFDPESTDHTLVIRVCKKDDAQLLDAVDGDGYLTVGDGSELKYSEAAISDIDELLIGDSYIFYTDKYGEVVYAVHVRSTELEVAYLMNYKTQTGLDSNLLFKVMRSDGTITNMDGAKNIKIRDKEGVFSVKTESGVRTLLNQGGDLPKRQPVMIRTNALGQINEIYMLASPEHPELTFHEIAYTNVGGSGKRWYQPAYTFHNVIQIKSGTTVFAVPHATRTDVEDYEFFISNFRLFKGSVYYPESGENAYYQIPIGIEKGAIAADYLVWEYPENGEARSNYINKTTYAIVTKISQAIHEETGDEVLKITYATKAGIFGNTIYYKNDDGSKKFTASNGTEVGVGDIILIGDDYFGYATNATTTLFYDYSEDLIIKESSANNYPFYDGFRLAKGVINKKDGNYIEVEITRVSGTKLTQVLDLTSAITINCDVSNNMFMKDRAPASLLSEGDSFFMIIGGGLSTALLIYE